jgi:RND family efflux transporter MFP subunit
MPSHATAAAEPSPASTNEAGRETLSSTTPIATRISGTVQSSHQGMASFKIGGHIRASFVKVGDRVRKGQLLAELDDTDLVLRERLAQATVQQAKIQAEQAQLDLKREEQLRKENVTSQTNIERSSNAAQIAKLGLESAQINLESAKKAVADSRLLSPYDGIVSKRLKDQGEWVGAGNAVYELYDAGEVEVSLKVPENYIRNITLGRTLNVSSPATRAKGRIKIIRIVPVIQEQSRTFEVIGSFVEKSSTILPGQFVEAELN